MLCNVVHYGDRVRQETAKGFHREDIEAGGGIVVKHAGTVDSKFFPCSCPRSVTGSVQAGCGAGVRRYVREGTGMDDTDIYIG